MKILSVPDADVGFCLQDKDVLADLQSCLYYYENVAESAGDMAREQEIKANKKKLAKIIGKIQQEAKCGCVLSVGRNHY